MKHIVSFDDGSVAVLTLLPLRVTVVSMNVSFRVVGVRREEASPGFGFCKLYGDGFELVVGNLNYDVGLLEPDSMPDVIFEFPRAEDEIARWPDKLALRVAFLRPAQRGEIPMDRTFRGAWSDDGRALGVDMTRAKDIWRDKMRAARAPLFQPLDTAAVSAISSASTDDTLRQIEAQKQVLRDVTADPALDAAATPDELKAVWPGILGDKPQDATAVSAESGK